MGDATVTSKLGFHIQRPEYPDWLKAHVARSKARVVKIMDPDHGEAKPFGDVFYIGRLYWGGEPDKQLIRYGAEGAKRWYDGAAPRMAQAPWVHLWELPNEPDVTSEHACIHLATFTSEAVRIMHDNGLAVGALCLSTGNPPDLSYWQILGSCLGHADALILHEYGMRTMTLDGWHLLRYRKAMQELAKHGYRVPPIYITETGIDYAGGPDTDGWRAQGISAEQYRDQLAAYDAELVKDPEVVATTPFTWQDYNWPSFAIDEHMSGLLADYMAERNQHEVHIPIVTPQPQRRYPALVETVLPGARLSQGFGQNPGLYAEYGLDGHNGIDLASPDVGRYMLWHGTQVHAYRAGRMVVGHSDGYGTYAYVYSETEDWLYAHLADATESRDVRAGDVLGWVGYSGNVIPPDARGTHLHLGVRPRPYRLDNGYRGYVDPLA